MKEAPYNRLRRIGQEYVDAINGRREQIMFRYPKAKLKDGWRLEDLAERTAAAKQLGYEVQLRVTDEHLEVWYVQKLPRSPVEFWP